MVCTGANVNFADMSYNGPVNTRSWTFTNGTPGTSSDSTLNVSYSTAGKHNVSLTVTNQAGNSTKTVNGAVIVSATTAQYAGWMFTEGFENATTFTNDWIVFNPSGTRKWERTTNSGYNSSASAYILNNTGNNAGEYDELVSPSYNISNMNSPVLKFQVAYAQRNNNSNDNLRVLYSTNCGQTWILKYSKSGSNLSTVNPTTTSFVPNSPSQWREETVTLSGISGNSNIRFKFYFKNEGGNNIYVDNINIASSTDVEEMLLAGNSIEVYPNPANTHVTVSFTLTSNVQYARLHITDMMGKDCGSLFNGTSLQQGKHNVTIDNFSTFAPGVYFIKLEADGQMFTQKLIVQ